MTEEEFEEHLKRTDRRIATVWVCDNGMVVVCDQFGQQMPDYQGRWAEMEAAIRRDAGPDVKWEQ